MAFFKKIFNPIDSEDDMNEEVEDNYGQTAYGAASNEAYSGESYGANAKAAFAHAATSNFNNGRQSQPFIRQAAGIGGEIVMVECRDLSSAQNIAVAFKRNATVICDLTNMNSVDYQRALDFVSGVAFVLNGSFIKISREIYILLPQNVSYHQESRGDAQMQQ